uniref:hypothetical protein n=1 Tax=Kluyvera ascorbata TaxID=51288 RepID=UPI003562C7BC
MYALITPTFIKHLSFIDKYLQSMDVYLLDKDIPIYLTIEEDSIDELYNITSKYNSLNINIISFEMLLRENGINQKTDDLLKKYGKFCYQTIKKFLTIIAIK